MNDDCIIWETAIPKQNKAALALIEELNQELMSRYSSNRGHELALEKIDNKNGIFIMALIDRKSIACGAVSKLEIGVGQIKRVYVKKKYRRRGIAKLLRKKVRSNSN